MSTNESMIARLSEYFDGLADLVPYKHYVDTDEYVDLRHMKHNVKQQTKAAFKQQHKQAKRAKLDPDKEISTTAAQLNSDAAEGEHGNGAMPMAPWLQDGGNVDPNDLKERLSFKLQTLQESRKAEERKNMVKQAKAWKQKQSASGIVTGSAKKRKAPDGSGGNPGKGQNRASNGNAKAAAGVAANGGSGGTDVMFNRLQVQDGKDRPKKRKLSKAALLQNAQAQAEAEKNGDISQEKASEQSWKKMMLLAKGEKILDDPSRLRRSIKRDQKEKQKRSAAWRERTEAVQQKQKDRQQKRTSNLQQRVDKKQAKKKAKREAKFLGAGFEGRTQALRPAGTKATP